MFHSNIIKIYFLNQITCYFLIQTNNIFNSRVIYLISKQMALPHIRIAMEVPIFLIEHSYALYLKKIQVHYSTIVMLDIINF